MKKANRKNSSTPTRTSTGTKSVSLKRFTAEMNAKNRAYNFILKNGLIDEFQQFCSEQAYSPARLKSTLKEMLKNLPKNKSL